MTHPVRPGITSSPVIGIAALLLTAFGAERRAAAIDEARALTRTDAAVDAFGVTGAGVTIAILDRGIDWRHPDFIRDDGTTRIRWIYDMSGQNGCPGSAVPVAYDAAQINAALRSGTALSTRDAVGHGTATAGAAAGNGRAFADGRFRGIAPEAELIVIKMTSEGAPAHGGVPAEAPFQACMLDALDWLDARITEAGRPCVAILNSGTQWGPIDGTSVVSRALDDVFGADRPGRICVLPSGDEGSLANHARLTFDDQTPAAFPFIRLSAVMSFGQLWSSAAPPVSVTITAGGHTVGPVTPGGFVDQNGIAILNQHPGSAFYPWTSTSGDRGVWFRITGNPGPGTIVVEALAPGAGAVDAYGDLMGPNLSSIVRFTAHLTPGRLTDYASTAGAIVVGNAVVRTDWIDLDGVPRSIPNEGDAGERWLKSSGGPTRDGRAPGVDLTAPGQNTFVSLAQESFYATSRSVQNLDGGGHYVRFGGTSASAPIVVGAVALMLERNPALTAADARAILRATARHDAVTGAVPNVDWGFGRLDVFRAVASATGCPADTDDSGVVDFSDLLDALAQWGPCSACRADLDGDTVVDFGDVVTLLAAWGPCSR